MMRSIAILACTSHLKACESLFVSSSGVEVDSHLGVSSHSKICESLFVS